MNDKFRGMKMVIMATVLEGDGKEDPYREVHYIYDPNNMYLAGTHGACVGKIDNYTQQTQQAKNPTL